MLSCVQYNYILQCLCLRLKAIPRQDAIDDLLQLPLSIRRHGFRAPRDEPIRSHQHTSIVLNLPRLVPVAIDIDVVKTKPNTVRLDRDTRSFRDSISRISPSASTMSGEEGEGSMSRQIIRRDQLPAHGEVQPRVWEAIAGVRADKDIDDGVSHQRGPGLGLVG